MGEWLTGLRRRVRAALRGRQLERDLQDEMAFHLEVREEQLRRAGAVDAHTAARRRFGSVEAVRDELREVWTVAPRARSVGRGLRYAARALRRSPGFAAVVVLTLGIGIGANTALFSVVNAVLIRPLGYAASEQLVLLHESFNEAQAEGLPFSALDFDDLRREQRSFASVAAYRTEPLELSGDGAPEQIAGAKVSAELFATLGVEPPVGRSFAPDEDRPDARVAILSWGLWQRRFGGDATVVGRHIQLDRQPYTVVGIMPAGFVFPRRGARFNGEPAEVWLPIGFTPRERVERVNMQRNSVVARLKDGVAIEAARAELVSLSAAIALKYPPPLIAAGFSPHLTIDPLRAEISGRVETPLLMLLAAVGLVLLIACANVANLILSRAAGRSREFAIRAALGARRGQLFDLLLSEALLLSAAGGVVGVVIAYWAVQAVPAVLARTIPNLHGVAIDLRVLAFTAAVCVATAFVCTLVARPAFDGDPIDSLREDSSRSTSSGGRLRVQRACVVVTVSLACVLLAMAGLFLRSFASLVSTEMGFRPAQVLTVSMTLPRTFYATAASVRSFYSALQRNLQERPAVQSVAVATDLPLTTNEMRAFTPEGAGAEVPSTTNLSWVDGPYFEVLGITLKQGRFFTPDEHLQDRRVVVVNEKLAALAWPGEPAVGKRLRWGAAGSTAPWLTVVGVIGNVADGPIGAEPGVHAYEPFRQLPDAFLNGTPNQFGRDLQAVVRGDGDLRALAALVRQEIAALDPALAIERVQPMTDRVGEVVAPRRFGTLLVAAAAAVALCLACVGLAGLLAYTIGQRRKEIAVRMALGADAGRVLRMVLTQGARLVGVGLAAGLAGSLLVTRLIASLLYQTSPYDPVTLAAVIGLLAGVAMGACALPAWRAARLDPVVALRADP